MILVRNDVARSRKIESAIERLKLASDMSLKYCDKPLFVCISGGKDSSVIQQLVIEANIPAVFHHSHTTMDAPETVYFLRDEFKRLEELGYKTVIHKPEMSMWRLIEHKGGFMPLRTTRYCCRFFKEHTVKASDGSLVFIATGVRWAESTSRKTRSEFEIQARTKKDAVRVLANDNEIDRKLFEDCKLGGERIVNPIIDWDDDDVWEFIRDRKIPYNPLYDFGFRRIGCIGCPMAPQSERVRQFEFWPRYKKNYINAIERGLKKKREKDPSVPYVSAEERFSFWLYDKEVKTYDSNTTNI